MTEAHHASDSTQAHETIRRGATGLRIVLTLLMIVIWAVIRPVLGAFVFFSLVWTLITEQAPPRRVRELANRLVAYSYRIGRYITYNTATVPFPFSDFPDAVEPPEHLGSDPADEVRKNLPSRPPRGDARSGGEEGT